MTVAMKPNIGLRAYQARQNQGDRDQKYADPGHGALTSVRYTNLQDRIHSQRGKDEMDPFPDERILTI